MNLFEIQALTCLSIFFKVLALKARELDLPNSEKAYVYSGYVYIRTGEIVHKLLEAALT